MRHFRKRLSGGLVAFLGSATLLLSGVATADNAPAGQGSPGAPAGEVKPPAKPPVVPDDGGEIRFQFVQLKERGVVRCALYATPADYMKKSFREVVGSVSGGRALCVFSRVPAGTYSMAAFHDENNNDQLDTGIFGIPTEGFATSNNAKGRMGPPKYKDAAFVFPGGVLSQELKMKY